MKIYIPKIASNSAIYTVFNVLQKAINFFLLPLYTIYLTPSDYGITNVLSSSSALLTFLLTFSIQAASSRFHYKYSKSAILVKKIWGSNLLFILVNSFFWILFTILFYNYTLRFLIGDEISFYPYVLIGILNCCFSPIYLYYQIYLQTTQRARLYVVNNLSFFVAQLFLTIGFVVGLKWGALGVVLAMLITNFIFATYALISLKKYIIYEFSWKILKKSLSYSLPLIPHSLSGWLNGMLDRIFINRIVNLANVGLYSISSHFGLIINMLGLGVNNAFTPWFFKNHDSISGRKKIVIFSDLILVFLCIVCFCIALFSKEILLIMTTEQYHGIWLSVIVLAFANLFDTYYYFYVAPLFLDKTPVLSVISISCALVNCAINIVLIKMFGYVGAAYSYFMVQFIKSCIVRFYSFKYHSEIIFHTRKHYGEALLGMFVIWMVFSLTGDVSFESVGIKVLALLVYLLALGLINKHSLISSYNQYVKKSA